MQQNAPARTPEVLEFLKRCASDMRTVTYGEVAAHIGLTFPPAIIPCLNHIRDQICRPKGLPWLSAIVVGVENHRPSDRWLPDDVRIQDGEFPELWWRGIVLQVFAADWTGVTLENAN